MSGEESGRAIERLWNWLVSVDGSVLSDELLCDIHGHEFEYTDEYENGGGHVQADKTCTRCGYTTMAWTGPRAERIRSLGYEVPTEVPENAK